MIPLLGPLDRVRRSTCEAVPLEYACFFFRCETACMWVRSLRAFIGGEGSLWLAHTRPTTPFPITLEGSR